MEKMLKGKMPAIEATMLVYSQDGEELRFPAANATLQVGDLVLLEKGNHVPADTKILAGTIFVEGLQHEALEFGPKSVATGGLLITEGSAKGYVFARAAESLLATDHLTTNF